VIRLHFYEAFVARRLPAGDVTEVFDFLTGIDAKLNASQST
jgi:hypothetical protein